MSLPFIRRVVGLPILLGFVQLAHAESLPKPGVIDSRIRTALYHPEQVYRLQAFVGYQIELVFEEGEQFLGQAGGDLEGITIGAHRHHVILKPRAANVSTNLVIYTDRRAYRFDYLVAARRPDPLIDEVTYAVRFIYPPASSSVGTPTPAERVEHELEQAEQRLPRNTNYWYCGHQALRPVAASDDGVHTRLTFGVRAELPAIFVRNADGSESLVNFHVSDGDVVVHRVAPAFVVRRGKLTGCIVNKGFIGGGTRLESGTITPAVRRERKEAQP